MKIRNGFVSNSSSSSFIMIGVKRKFDNREDMHKEFNRLWNLDHNIKYSTTMDGDTIFGYDIARWHADDNDVIPVDMEEVIKHSQNLSKVLKFEDIPQIYVGTRSS